MSLYHSSTEGLTFYIAGYSLVDRTDCVLTKATLLIEEAKLFAETIGASIASIHTEEVNKVSRRYRYMRVYYTKQTTEELKNCTLPVFEIREDWTMQKWLEF